MENDELFNNYKKFTGESSLKTQFSSVFRRRMRNWFQNFSEQYLNVLHPTLTVITAKLLINSLYQFFKVSQMSSSQSHAIEDIITIGMPAVIVFTFAIATPLFSEHPVDDK